MSQLRRFAPPSRSDDAVASYVASQPARAAVGWNGRAATAQTPFSKLATKSPPVMAGNARKSTALVQVGFSLAVAACDVVVIIAAALIAELSYQALFGSPYGSSSMISVGSLVAAMFVFANSTRQEYRYDNYLKSKGHVGRSATLWSLAFLWVLAISFITKVTDEYSRGTILLFYFIGILALIGTRIGIVRLAQKYVGRGSALSRNVFIVGYADEIATFRERYEASMLGMDIVGVFPLRRHGMNLQEIELAAATARGLRPDEVFIIVSWSHKRTIDACVDAFRKLPVAVHLGPEAVLSRFAHARISEIGCILSLDLVRRPLSHGEIILKRAFDLVGAGLGLAVLAPLFLVVAILIKLDSPGPALFSQRRYGFNQEPFRILKFRTMTTMEDGPCVVQAQRNDVRITRVGRWLRRFNIDELPQLVNVLRGEMSLVGPRPHASAHDELFEQWIEFYARRHNIKPGITGWAQVNGFRGEIRTQEDILRRIEYDLFYLDNWSIWLDFECIWRTIVTTKAYCNAY